MQAESVAYVVCQHFGIDSSQYSFGYVASWSGSVELEVLEQSLTVIQNGALQIIDSTEMELMVRGREITLSEHAFDDKGYLHFKGEISGQSFDGLFRVYDHLLSDSMTIVSLDGNFNDAEIEGQWGNITENLREYSQEKYGELIARENPDLTARMRDLGQIPYYVDGFSEDFLMWKDTATGKTHGYDGWDGVASSLDDLDGLHQTELRQLWEIETNDPATQEWRSLLHPDEQALVGQWDKAYDIESQAAGTPHQSTQKSYYKTFQSDDPVQAREAHDFQQKTGWHMVWGCDNDGLNGDTWVIFRNVEDLPRNLINLVKALPDYRAQGLDKVEQQPSRSIKDKLADAKIEADRMNAERHAGRAVKQHDMER